MEQKQNHESNHFLRHAAAGLSTIGLLLSIAILMILFYFINTGLTGYSPSDQATSTQKVKPPVSHEEGSKSNVAYVSAYHKGMQGAQNVVDATNDRYGKK